jgi:hypothetical protein
MRHLVVFTALITAVITTSLANTNSNDLASAVQHPTVTPKGPALVKARIPKPKLFRTNPHRKAHFLLIDDNNDVFVQDEDLATGYRRRDLTRVEHPDGISERVRWRLFLARQLALLKYREVHG